jgi:hypothetical protein
MTRLRLSDKEREKYRNDPLVKAWITRLLKGSEKTAAMWPTGLFSIFHQTHTTPSAVVAMTKHELRDLGEAYEAAERERGTKPSTISMRLAVLRNFIHSSSEDTVLPSGFFKVKGSNASKHEAALTDDQIQILRAKANLREDVLITLVLGGSARAGVFGNYHGDDGAKLGDVTNLVLERDGQPVVEWTAVPAWLTVRETLSKAGHEYLMPIGETAQEVLANYLRTRRIEGEKLTPESPLIRRDRTDATGRPHFPTSSDVGEYVRSALNRAHLGGRPTVLRTTWESRMVECEMDGKVQPRISRFWGGRAGETADIYSVHRGGGNLGETFMSRMRTAYLLCEPSLGMAPPAQRAPAQTARVGVLLDAGYTQQQVDEMGPLTESKMIEAFMAKHAERRAAKPLRIPTGMKAGDQTVADGDAVQAYIDAGWRFVSPFNVTQAIMVWPAASA